MVGKEFEDGKTQDLAHPEIVEVLALFHHAICDCSQLVLQVVFSVFHLCPAPLQLNILDRVYSLVERSTINMAVCPRSSRCNALSLALISSGTDLIYVAVVVRESDP